MTDNNGNGLADERTAPFPQLRAAYMRAIARAWRDPHYEDCLRELGPEGGLEHLETEYHIKFPWDINFHMNLEDENLRPAYDPIFCRDWFGDADEFIITLPGKPDDMEHAADHLARYLQEFPTMLGRPKTSEPSESSESSESSKPSHGSAEAPDDFAEFGVMTGRIISLVWGQPFLEKLFFDEDNPDARGLVQGALDYVVKWNFRLKFKRNEKPLPRYPVGSDDTKAYNDYWKDFPRTTVMVYVPANPFAKREDGKGAKYLEHIEAGDRDAIIPAALAAYNDTSDQYPFSCA